MIVYNISIKINATIEKEWVKWQQDEHIPEVMATGYFTDYKLYRLLQEDASGDPTYIVQYFAPRLENYHHYVNEVATCFVKRQWKNGEINLLLSEPLCRL